MFSSTSRGIAAAVVVTALITVSQAKAQLPCVGDCNGNGAVAINELIIGVNIALGNRPVGDCASFDSNGNGAVAVNELVQAVNAALRGCVGGVPTATATSEATEVPATETPTAEGPTATETATSEATEVPATETPTAEGPTATATSEATEVPATETPTVGGPAATATATSEATEVPATETPTVEGPTATATATIEPTLTATATEVPTVAPGAQTLAGASTAVVNGVSAIPNLIAAVVAGFTGGNNATLSGIPGGGAGAKPCQLGGTIDSSVGLTGIDVQLAACVVSRPDGGSAVFDGRLSVEFANLNDALALRGKGSFTATIDFKDDQGELIVTSRINLTGDVDINTSPGGTDPCAIDTPFGEVLIREILLTNLEGPVASNVPGSGSAEVDFDVTRVDLEVTGNGADCVPTSFVVFLDGPATITQNGSGESLVFDLTFEDFTITATGTGNGQTQVELAGGLTADCFAGTVVLSTPQSLSLLLGQFCPGSGVIAIEDIGEVVFSSSGVAIGDLSFASCLDPALQVCVP